MDFTFIDEEKYFDEFRQYLVDEKINKIAMDFEGEFNLHMYGEKLCLIQIYDGNRYFIIDPIKIVNEKITKLFSNRSIIKYMYSPLSDIKLAYNQYGVKINCVFDLKILIDILNIEPKNLSGIINSLFNVEIKDKKKYQRYNWTKRPIAKDALQYALTDVKYLFDIYNILMDRIKSENKFNELIMRIIKQGDYNFEKINESKIFKKDEYKKLIYEDKIKFKELYEIREHYAKIFNVPPYYIRLV